MAVILCSSSGSSCQPSETPTRHPARVGGLERAYSAPKLKNADGIPGVRQSPQVVAEIQNLPRRADAIKELKRGKLSSQVDGGYGRFMCEDPDILSMN